MTFALAKKPESIKKILFRSLSLYRVSILRVAILAFLMSLVAFVPRLIMTFAGPNIFLSITRFNPQTVWLMLAYLGSLFFFIGLLWRMHCVMIKNQESIWDDFKISIKKLPLIIAAAILQSVLLGIINMTVVIYYWFLMQNLLVTGISYDQFMVAMCVLVFQTAVVIYIYFLFIMYLPLILTENQGIIAAFKKSVTLVWTRWWRTTVTLVIPWLVYLLILVLIRKIFKIDLHIYFISGIPNIWVTCLHIILFALFIPWFGAVLLLQLRDLERRKTL